MSKPEGIIVGVDGGDGNYSIVNGEDAIVTAAFVKSESGYQRIQIIPKAEGETGITVRDGSGSSTLLRVKVDECLKLIWSKRKTVSWLPEKLQKNKRRILRMHSLTSLP